MNCIYCWHFVFDNIDLNTRNKHGRTIFHFTCFYGQIQVVKLILGSSISKNIELNARNKHERTQFILLAFMDKYKLLDYLQEHKQKY